MWAYAAKTAGLAALHVVAWWTIGMSGWLVCCWNVDYRHICYRDIPFPGGNRAHLSAVFSMVFARVDYRHGFAWTIGIFRGNPEIRGGLSAYGMWTIGMPDVGYRHGCGGLSACDIPDEALCRLG